MEAPSVKAGAAPAGGMPRRLAVRASKRYGAFGVILMVLGVAALIFG